MEIPEPTKDDMYIDLAFYYRSSLGLDVQAAFKRAYHAEEANKQLREDKAELEAKLTKSWDDANDQQEACEDYIGRLEERVEQLEEALREVIAQTAGDDSVDVLLLHNDTLAKWKALVDPTPEGG